MQLIEPFVVRHGAAAVYQYNAAILSDPVHKPGQHLAELVDYILAI